MSKSRLTKIITTLGPASWDESVMRGLLEAGANVFRVNCSHSDTSKRGELFDRIKKASESANKGVGILLDLQGPKIRVGKLENDQIELRNGACVEITSDEILGTNLRFNIQNFHNIVNSLQIGHTLLLDDGIIRLKVIEKVDKHTVKCEVLFGGILKNHKGVNFPNTDLVNIESLTSKDVEDLKHGLENGIALVAPSFVRSVHDIEILRSYMPKDSKVKIIAKIEKPQAVENIDSILDNVDGIMVARGDLGVEIPCEKLPAIQKKLIQKANDHNKLVITATQMLESMVSSPMPTRAEVTDVANAIFDGTDAIMLSGETASGKHPVLVVETMHKIALEAEEVAPRYRHDVRSIEENIARSACDLAERVNATAIASFTLSGQTAIRVSKQRPPVKVIALAQNEMVARQLNLYWGITPILMHDLDNTETMMHVVEKSLMEKGLAKKGDVVIITAGMPIAERGDTNFIKIHKCLGKY